MSRMFTYPPELGFVDTSRRCRRLLRWLETHGGRATMTRAGIVAVDGTSWLRDDQDYGYWVEAMARGYLVPDRAGFFRLAAAGTRAVADDRQRLACLSVETEPRLEVRRAWRNQEEAWLYLLHFRMMMRHRHASCADRGYYAYRARKELEHLLGCIEAGATVPHSNLIERACRNWRPASAVAA